TWFLGPAVTVSGRAATHRLAEAIEVEDTAHVSLGHAGGTTSLLTATNCYALNAPVTVTVHWQRGTAVMAGDLTITWNDGTRQVVPASPAASGGRSYWGDPHHALIADSYQHRGDDTPFWVRAQDGLDLIELTHAGYDSSPSLRR